MSTQDLARQEAERKLPASEIARQWWQVAIRTADAVLVSAWTVPILVGVGILLRIVRYASDRSLWLDESYLALNLSTRSYSDLVGTLDFNQGAPVGFLVLEKAMVQAFGNGEHILRLLPFLVGCASVLLFVVVARDLLTRRAVPVALLLFAVLDPFVYYSAEAKQYGFDVFATLVLLALFHRALRRSGSSRWFAAFGVAGVAAPWFSHPSVFLLAGMGVVAIALALRDRDSRKVARWVVTGALWLVSFGVEWVLSIRHLHQLQATVTGGTGDGHGSTSRHVLKGLYLMFSVPGELPRTVVGVTALLTVAGAYVVARRRPAVVGAIVLGTLALLVAGDLHRYPVGQRFILFLMPVAVLLIAACATELVTLARGGLGLAIAAVVAAMIFVPALAKALPRFVDPPDSEPTRQLLADLQARWHAGDTLYLFQNSQYAFRYYLTCDGCNSRARSERALWPFRAVHGPAQTAPAVESQSPALVVGSGGSDQLADYRRDLGGLTGKQRVWLLFTHYYPLDLASLTTSLNARGTQLAAIRRGSAVLYLYDFAR